MFWADRIATEVKEGRSNSTGPLVVRDEKTVSGRVHVGAMRGVAIHGVVSEALEHLGVANTFFFEINDFDPMDDIPSYLSREQYEQYLGMPLNRIPSPDGKAASFAEFFAEDFIGVITHSGFEPSYYRSSELYLSGKMDGVIREAIEGSDTIRRIYKEVSGSERQEKWLPIAVVCPTCGKLSTTEASDFDGETVAYHCSETKVDWTRGCGAKGRISPFGGNAKLPWKVEWPSKWKVMQVQVEGGGKDHSTRGGSRDIGVRISREVFNYEPPFNIPYEFLLIGGQKMSSSKGRGASAREISELLPQKIFRLALLSKDYNQAINFDPSGDTIPVLYDLYDKLAESYKAGVEDDYAQLFRYAHAKSVRAGITVPFLPRFSQVAFLVQMSHLNMKDEVAALKGTPLTPEDEAELNERATYAKHWLKEYAPEKFVFALQDILPEAARSLTAVQKKALGALSAQIESKATMPTGEELHAVLHGLKDSEGIAPGELFGAVYAAFLGKTHGPKAGWFLSVLPRDFVLLRLKEAAQ